MFHAKLTAYKFSLLFIIIASASLQRRTILQIKYLNNQLGVEREVKPIIVLTEHNAVH